MDFVEFYPFSSDSPKLSSQRKSAPNSPTKSPIVRKSVKRPSEQEKTHVNIEYHRLEEAKGELDEAKRDDNPNLFLCFDGPGYISAVYVGPTSASSLPEESLVETYRSLKISKMLHKYHAIANTFLLGGVFYQSSDLLGISSLYFCWCAAVYGVSSVDTNKKYLESQNLEEQNILKSLRSFQRNQACLNMLAGACLLAGGFADMSEIGYAFCGLALATAVGNSVFFGCTN